MRWSAAGAGHCCEDNDSNETPARMKKMPMPFNLGINVLPKQTVNAPNQVMMIEDTKTCHGLETKSACLTAYI